MKISYNWLLDYLPEKLAVEEISTILTQIGLEVEGVEEYYSIPGGLDGLVIGQVLTCEKHPNADRLKLTSVDVGEEKPLRIVCGAPNVATGQLVVVATVGATLYPRKGEPFTIKRSKIRGESSEGMLCAEDEIGLGDSHHGIITLTSPCELGTPASEYFELSKDYILEIGLTANRADSMSHYGVARDICAYLTAHSPIETPPVRAHFPHYMQVPVSEKPVLEVDEIHSEGCYEYWGVTIKGVSVGPSPAHLADKLRAIGLTPINNVVDVTNFVLHELGQPLHAFDMRAFSTGKISVKTLPHETEFITLEGKLRKLANEDLMICNEAEPLCLAGVLGGKESGVTEATTDIFLEGAQFSPTWVRKSARKHAISTDASYRFERGVDPELTERALLRAATLIVEFAGGKIMDHHPYHRTMRTPHHRVTFSPEIARERIGMSISDSEITHILDGLEINITAATRDEENRNWWYLEVPTYRIDVTRQEDVIEEILRLKGFDTVPIPDRLHFSLPSNRDSAAHQREQDMHQYLVGAGFHEMISLTLVPESSLKKIDDEMAKRAVKLVNPLSSDLDTLRPTLLLGALEAVKRNISYQQPSMRLYEFGNVQGLTGLKPTDKDQLAPYYEEKHLSLTITGSEQPESWYAPAGKTDIFQLKGYIEALLRKAGFSLKKMEIDYLELPKGFYEQGSTLCYERESIGHFGMVHPRLLKLYGVKQPVFFAELCWPSIIKHWLRVKTSYHPLPKFPSVRRDLSVELDSKVKFIELQMAAFQAEKRLLKEVTLFDVYEGDKITDGKKSYALAFILQDESKTLNEKTIEQSMNRILKALEKSCGAKLRK